MVAIDPTSTLSRSSFVASGLSISLDRMPANVRRVLEANQIDRATLERIAGSDRVIRDQELGLLYDALRSRSSEARTGNITAVAEVYEALRGPSGVGSSTALPSGTGLRSEMRRGRRPDDREGASEPDTAQETQPSLPELPEGYEHRARRVGRRNVTTHTEIAPSDLLRARQIAALPPAPGRMPSVRSYVDAIAARDRAAELQAGGQRAEANRIRKPEGVTNDQWALTVALQHEGISTRDVESYLATGQLPDLLDEDGEIMMSGADRMAQLERSATQGGSWGATNTFTFLIGARRSAMAAERLAMQTRMDIAEIQSAITASESLDRDLGRGLQGIYRARTYSAGRNGQRMIDRATTLDAQARAARDRGDTTAADRLAGEAQRARDRGARIGQSEGDYRSVMRLRGAGDAYRTAARGQIETGTSRVEDMRRSALPLPDQAPPELGDDDGTLTSNNVRGAGRLLTQAGTVDGDGGRSHASLGLETARQGVIADFHRLHVDRSTYHQRVGENGAPPPPRTAGVEQHRQAYLDARAEQSRAIMERIGLYGPLQSLTSADARDVGRLQSDRATVMQELNASLGTSLATDRQVEAQGRVVTELANAATASRTGVTDSQSRAGDQRSASSDQRDSADPWTRTFQTSGAERRDHQAIADADVAERVVGAQTAVAVAGRGVAERRLADGRDLLRGLEAQQARDRADAERVRSAMSNHAGAEGRTTSIRHAYDRTRALGDDSARAGARALDRADAAGPPDAPRDERAMTEIASTRLDLARYWTGTTETHALALGDPGRAGATDRLDTAATLIDTADRARTELPAGDLRASLASGVVRERSALGQANSDYRPGVSRDQLRAAEDVANTDLTGPRSADQAGRLGEARGQIGSAAIQSTVRSDARFETIFQAGHHDETAQDQMLGQSQRLLGRTDLPNDDTVRGARSLLRRFETNLDQVPAMFRRSGQQMRNGYDLAAAQSGVMSRGQGQANSVKMSSLITGAVWVVSIGNVDMKDDVQRWAEEGATRMRTANQRYTDEQVRGADDLARGFESARRSGHAMQYLNAYRMLGLNNMGTMRVPQQTFERNRDFMKSFLPPGRADTREWAAFQSAAWPSNPSLGPGSPLAQSLRGPVIGYRDALEALGDERLAIITHNQQFMLTNAKRNLDDATENMWWYVGINAIGEIGLALVTLGASAPSAVGGVADAANAGRVGLQAASVARTVGTMARIADGIATFRAAHPVLHAGAVAVSVGGAMTGVNYVARRAFGESGATNFVAVAGNFIPIGAGARAAGLATAGRRAAVIGEEGVALSRNVSWAALREGLGWSSLVAHSRFYGPQFAMAGLQVGGSIVVVPAAARALGLERSEFAQAAMNVALGAFVTSGFAAGMHRMGRQAQSTAAAEHLVDGVVSLRGEVAQSARAQMQQGAMREIDGFQSRTHGRMPTAEEVSGLRTRLVERLGVDPSTDRGRAQMQLIEGSVEGLRVQRAGELGLTQAIREERTGAGARTRDRVGAMVSPDEISPSRPPTRELVQRAVELAGERLYRARGGEAAGASRALAYRDAAQQLAGTFHAQARTQIEAHGRSPFTDSLVQAESFAGDRAASTEIAARLQIPGPNGQPPVIGPREAARLEPFLGSELATARATLEQTPANADMRAHWSGVRQRLIRDVGLTEPAADATIRTMQGEVFQGTVARRIVGEQVAAGEGRPLSNADIMNAARDTAARMGLSRDAAEVLARDVVQSRPQLEAAGMVRPGGETRPEAAFRRFRSEHPELADRFPNLTADQFTRAFGEAPNPDRLAVLARDPRFVELASRDPAATRRVIMRGPEPNLTPPDPHAVQAARAELAALRPGQRLSDSASEALVQDTVFAAREALLAEHRAMRPGNENMRPDDAFSCREMAGWCGMGQALTSTRLVELGLPADRIRTLQAAQVFRQADGAAGFNHAFLIAEMPNGKRYLVDTTFRQFFDGEAGPNGIGRPGDLMRRTERGSRIADQLLERGFVELTPDVAAEYGRALGGVENGRTFTVQDYLNAHPIPLDYTRAELHTLPPPPPAVGLLGTASAGRPIELSTSEVGHARGGEFRGDRFTGGGHGFSNVAELEAHGYQRTTRETLTRYRDDLTAYRQRRQTWQAWQRNRTGDRPMHPGQEPRPADYGLTSDRIYFIERNGGAWTGGIFPAGNRIHTDGHTWFPREWGEAQIQGAAALLAREGAGVTRADDPSRAKLTAWMRLDASGRVELAPDGLANPAAQGYIRVSMIVPTDPNAGRTVFADMRQR